MHCRRRRCAAGARADPVQGKAQTSWGGSSLSVRGLSLSAWDSSPVWHGIPLAMQLVLQQEELALGLRIPVPPLLRVG
eukprot:scaffold80177_cov64-Phaeocystis_antarctica.AAC.3